MAGGYERVSGHDIDEEPPALPQRSQPIPNSPPPSFHSRASSVSSRGHGRSNSRVDQTLADAFGANDDSDDEADDRQRLVRSAAGTSPSSSGVLSRTPATQGTSSAPSAHGTGTTASAAAGRSATSGRVYGGGVQSDGVFSNLTAKPEVGEKEEQPPSYEQAAADAAPPYWETTILAPGLAGPDEVYIDGMPVGSVFSFAWNAMISMSFQFVGFVLTYILSSTHAAKNGSRAGLGITLIQYGFYMRADGSSGGDAAAMGGPASATDGYANPPDPNSHDFDPGTVGTSGGSGSGSFMDVAASDWVSYILMIIGWFILIRSVSEFIQARRHEQLVLQSPDRGLGVAVIAEGEPSERVV